MKYIKKFENISYQEDIKNNESYGLKDYVVITDKFNYEDVFIIYRILYLTNIDTEILVRVRELYSEFMNGKYNLLDNVYLHDLKSLQKSIIYQSNYYDECLKFIKIKKNTDTYNI